MLISVGQVEPGPRETSPAHVIFEQGRSPRVIFLQPTRTCPYPHMNQAFRRVPVGSAAQLPVPTEPGLTKMSQFDCPVHDHDHEAAEMAAQSCHIAVTLLSHGGGGAGRLPSMMRLCSVCPSRCTGHERAFLARLARFLGCF